MDYDDTSQQLIRLPSGTDDDSHRRCLKLKHCWKFPSHPFHAHLLLLLFRMDFWAPRQVRHREKFATIRAAFAAICEPKSTTKIENNHNLSGGHGKRETRTLFSCIPIGDVCSFCPFYLVAWSLRWRACEECVYLHTAFSFLCKCNSSPPIQRLNGIITTIYTCTHSSVQWEKVIIPTITARSDATLFPLPPSLPRTALWSMHH